MSTETYAATRTALLTLNSFAISQRLAREKDGAVSFNADWRLCSKPNAENSEIAKNNETSEESAPDAALMNSHNVIEEMMILANRAVAETLVAETPRGALLRRHRRPLGSAGDEVNRGLAELGAPALSFASNEALAQSMAALRGESGAVGRLLELFLRAALTEAEYLAAAPEREDTAHFGLAVRLYTHFTSPIRRYADVCVHRMLLAVVGAQSKGFYILNKYWEKFNKVINNNFLFY